MEREAPARGLRPGQRFYSVFPLRRSHLTRREEAPVRMKSFAVVALAVVVLGSILALPRAEAAPPMPYNLFGIARDASFNPLQPPTRITGFIDGVDYSNGTSVYSLSGNYDMDVYGNWWTNTGQPNTPEVKEGGDIGDQIMVVAGDMTTTGQVFTVLKTWSTGTVDFQPFITLAPGPANQPVLLKIARIVTRPADAGTQYVYICNPTSQRVDASFYTLERDSPGMFNGPTHAISGVIPPGGLLYVDENAWVGGGPPNVNGDNLKLVWTNNGSAFGTSNVVIDRVEFNATSGGTLFWEPGNTIMSDAAAPALGREIRRTFACGDTNNNAVDFTDAPETGRPSSNTPPTITVVTPNGGEVWSGNSIHSVTWQQADAQSAQLSVTVEYSADDQASWSIIYSNPNELNGLRSTVPPWTVPCINTNVAWVRVRAFDGGGLPALDTSDGPFTIDCRRPVLINTNPTGGATGIAVNAPVILTFNETMNRATTQTATNLLPNPGGIAFTWSTTSFVDDTVTVQHNDFAGNTLYTVTVSCVATDVSDPGNQLLNCPETFQFRTVQTNVSPTVVLTSPVGGEIWTGGSSHNIVYTTTDPDDNPINMDLFYSTNAGASWTPIGTTFPEAPGAHSYVWNPVPSVNTNAARVRVCATDSANPQVCQASPSNFTIDSTRPTVTGNSPTAANDVALTTPIVIRFSETMNRAALQSALLFAPSPPGVSGIVYQWSATTVTDDTLTIQHNDFAPCTTFTVTVGTGARDISDPGNTLLAAFSWTFGTECAPVVTITTPAGGEVWTGNSAHNVVFQANDTDAAVWVWINASTDGGVTFPYVLSTGSLRNTGAPVTVLVTVPPVDSTNARVRVTAQDSTKLETIRTSPIFTIDAIPPTVSSSTPADGDTGVDISAPFTIVFSEPMNRAETNASITLSPGTWPPFSFTWSANSRTVTVTHTPALATSTAYTISISIRAKDQSDPGNPLAAAASISFTTGTTGGITADAGPDRTGEVGSTFTLDGSGSTGAITNYTWSIQLPGGGTDTRYGQTATYAFNAVGAYTITLTVRDASGNTDTDTATVTITELRPADFLSQYWWLLLILIIAIVAALLFLLMGKRRKKEEPEEAPPAPAAKPPSKPAAPPPRAAAPAAAKPAGGTPKTVACPSCGTIVDSTDTECFMCGTALSK